MVLHTGFWVHKSDSGTGSTAPCLWDWFTGACKIIGVGRKQKKRQNSASEKNLKGQRQHEWLLWLNQVDRSPFKIMEDKPRRCCRNCCCGWPTMPDDFVMEECMQPCWIAAVGECWQTSCSRMGMVKQFNGTCCRRLRKEVNSQAVQVFKKGWGG